MVLCLQPRRPGRRHPVRQSDESARRGDCAERCHMPTRGGSPDLLSIPALLAGLPRKEQSTTITRRAQSRNRTADVACSSFHRGICIIDKESPSALLVCIMRALQVSMAWSGPLYAYFATAGYTFMYSSYGNEDNGFMGVGVAVPLHTYDVLGAEMGRLAGTVQWPRNKGAAPGGAGLAESSSDDTDENSDSSEDESYDEGDEAEPAMAAAGVVSASAATTAQEVAVPEGRRRMSRKEKKLAKKVMEGKVDVGLGQGRRRPHRLSDALDMLNISVSLKRKNCMVSAKLRCKQTGVTFGVSTYHMPCAYKKEDIMLVHAALAFQRAHRYIHPAD